MLPYVFDEVLDTAIFNFRNWQINAESTKPVIIFMTAKD